MGQEATCRDRANAKDTTTKRRRDPAHFSDGSGSRVHGEVAEALNGGGLAMLVNEAEGSHGRGGLVGVAALMRAENVAKMAVRGRGILSIVVDHVGAARLHLMHMSCEVSLREGRPYFLTSVEAAACEGTGISAGDRAMTMRAAGAPDAKADALRTPGHVIPILVSATRRQPGNMAQAAYWLVRETTPYDVAAWCDALADGGELATADECRQLALSLNIPISSAPLSGPQAEGGHNADALAIR